MFLMLGMLIASTIYLETSQINEQDINSINRGDIIPSSAADHTPISIDGNVALDALCDGNGTDGTYGNPHIIEGYTIDGGIGNAIEILNTDRYLKIQNCVFGGMSGTESNGIYLSNANNITVNTCSISTAGKNGIYIISSDNCSVTNCEIFNNNFYQDYSTAGINNLGNNNAFISNNIHHNSMGIQNCGMWAYYFENSITNNTMLGFSCGDDYGTLVTHNILVDNGNGDFNYQIWTDGWACFEENIIAKIDSDRDGLIDYDEYSIYNTDFLLSDTDCDNLNDGFEVKIGTDPLVDDTDGDGYYDGIEVAAATDLLNASDYPDSDTTTDPHETPPDDPTGTNGDFVIAGYPISLIFIVSIIGMVFLFKNRIKK